MRPQSIERSRNLAYFDPVQGSSYFAAPYRQAIEQLTSRSPRLNDLTESFPAVLFALATGYGTTEDLQRAYHMICSGAPLKKVTSLLGIPWWMKKLPPQTFEVPFAGELPDSAAFSRKIVNCFPKHSYDLASWFRKTIRAYQLCDESFALWLSENPMLYSRMNEVGENDASVELLAAWAWYSQNEDTQAHALMQTAWHPNIGIHKALDAAKTWYNRSKLVLYIGPEGIQDCWLQGMHINGYDIVPLRTAEEFILESQVMGNCLDQYADQIRFHRVRVFSIRRDGIPIANIEIGPHEDDRTMPGIEQVRGPKNRRVNPIIWQLAYAFMGQQNFSSRPNGPSWSCVSKPFNQHPLWSPYRMALHMRNVASADLSIFNLDQTEKLLNQLEGLSLLDSE